MSTETVQPPGDKMRKAIKWVSDMQQADPAKERAKILDEAQVRFNLSPKECEFLNKNFSAIPSKP